MSYILIILLLWFFIWYFFMKFQAPNQAQYLKRRCGIPICIYGLLMRQRNFENWRANTFLKPWLNLISYITAGVLPSKQIPVLFIIGAWCLAVFILSNIYISLVTSFILAPNPQPLIKSIYELQQRPEVRLVSDYNYNVGALILVILHYNNNNSNKFWNCHDYEIWTTDEVRQIGNPLTYGWSSKSWSSSTLYHLSEMYRHGEIWSNCLHWSKLSFKNKNLYILVMLCACFVGKMSRVEMGLYWQQWKMIFWLRENATWKCLKVSTWSCKYLGPCRRKVLILTQLTLGMCRFFFF